MASSIASTLSTLVADVATVPSASMSSTSAVRVTPQGGILEGGNPSRYDPKNPIILFIIQAGIIIAFCRVLHFPLSWLRQPRVIAEVIGGILLGPSVMGRIPGFTEAIFPTASLPNLNLVANLGLILFLFLVGLEVDLRYFVSNWRVALSVGMAGMALPFGLGCAIAWGLYHEFHGDDETVPISFGVYMLFIGVAMAITAFPVLCRILSELKLLSTPVGIIVLSAGISNDVIGWVLLALCVALVNAGSGLTALWVLLTCVGYILFLVSVGRPAFLALLRSSGALHDGPSQGIVALTLMIALTSAFFTGVIGVHPIFGAFLAGLICPHEGGFAIKVTEKIEDLVSAILLPLYFALSGLSTNLGLLDDGKSWAYVCAVIAVAFCAKFIGGALGARLNGLVWRESFTIGALMSCKGLVELIVLNIGLQAGILSTRTFTIFVVMALVTTFATTPLTAWLYPSWYQRKLEAWKKGEIEWESGNPQPNDCVAPQDKDGMSGPLAMKRLLVYLRLENMGTLLEFVSLFSRKAETSPRRHPAAKALEVQTDAVDDIVARPVEVHGVRLVLLNERGSTVMKVSEADDYAAFDPVLNAFRVLGQICRLAVTGEVMIVPENSFAETISNRVTEEASELLVLPWSYPVSLSEALPISQESMQNRFNDDAYSTFALQTLLTARCHVAILVDQGPASLDEGRPSPLHRSYSRISLRDRRRQQITRARLHHIFMPFFGFGPDDHVAFRLVLDLLSNPEVTATIVFYDLSRDFAGSDRRQSIVTEDFTATRSSTTSTVHGTPDQDEDFFAAAKRSLPASIAERVVLETTSSTDPLRDAVSRAHIEAAHNSRAGGSMVVMARRHRPGSIPTRERSSTECLGPAADAFIASGIRTNLLVVQAKPES